MAWAETGPAGGDDGQADSVKANGTMSVKTYGKEGKLILTIGEEEHLFLLDTDGKLSEHSYPSARRQAYHVANTA